MHKITLTVTNPLTGDSQVATYQIDASSFDETAWAAGYPLISDMLQKLAALSTDKEPAQWLAAATTAAAVQPATLA